MPIRSLSGYLLITLIFITALTAISSADWIVANSSFQTRAVMAIGLIFTFIALMSRINSSKMSFRSRRAAW